MNKNKRRVLSKIVLAAALPLAVLAVFIFSQPKSTQALGEVGIWHFNETSGATASDSSGNNNTGTLINGPVWTTGKSGNALQFDGVNDYALFNTISDITFTKSYSVSLWVNINDVSSGQNIFTHSLSSSDRAAIYIYNNIIRAGTYNGTTDSGASGTISLGWNHIVFVHQAGGANYLYLNSINQIGTSTPGTSSMATFTIGSTSYGSYFNGSIDEVKIYNRALSAEEVLADYLGEAPAVVSSPIFSPVQGIYSSTQSVSISSATSGATIYYTLDNSAPTISSSVYSSPLAISSTATIKAIAVKSGMADSAVATAVYTITPPETPYLNSITISPFSASVVIGGTQTFTATPRDQNGNIMTGITIAWASSNTAVATVNSSGIAAGVSAGSSVITASSGGKSGTAVLTVNSQSNGNVPINNVAVSAIKTDSVNIAWDSTVAGTSIIEYGTTVSYGFQTVEDGLSYFHSQIITGLTAGTLYHYRIRTKDYNGVENMSDDYTFTTRTQAELDNVITAARVAQGGSGLPKTYYVSPIGNDALDGLSTANAWQSPSVAVSRAYAGDTIMLMDGTWQREYIFFPHAGIDIAPITLTAYTGSSPILDGVDNTIMYQPGHYNDGMYNTAIVAGDISSNFSIHNIVISNIKITNYFEGVRSRESNYININNMEIYNTSGYAIMLVDDNNLNIESNNIHDTGGWLDIPTGQGLNSVYVATNYGSTYNISIKNNLIWKNPGTSMIGNSQGHNLIDLNNYLGLGKFKNIKISNNRLLDTKSGNNGLYLHETQGSYLTNIVYDNNLIENNNGNHLSGMKDSFFINNTINHTYTAVSMQNLYYMDNVTIADNEINNSIYSDAYMSSISSHDFIFVNNKTNSTTTQYNYHFLTGGGIVQNNASDRYGVRTDNGAITVQYLDNRVFTENGANTVNYSLNKSEYITAVNTGGIAVSITAYSMTATPASGSATVSVASFDTSLPFGSVLANFTADTTNGNNITFTVSTLKPNTNYLIKKGITDYTTVQADSTGKITFTNSIWPASNFTITETTGGSSNTAPSAPQTLTSTSSDSSVSLLWLTPSSTGGSAITGYKVYRSTSSGTETLLTTGGCSSLGNVLSCTDSNLTNGTAYYYQVTAVNSIGESIKSNETIANPQATKIQGTVSNSSSAPIFGATISAGAVSITTDSNGNYSLNVPAGTYTVTVNASATGYATQSKSASVITAQTTTVNFTMTQSDTTPPLRSNALPSGELSAGTIQANLALTTSENSTCKYSTSANTAYASMTNTFSTTGNTSHARTIMGLTNGQSYSYYIRCQDANNNPNIDDLVISFSVANVPPPPPLPPVRSNGAPTGILSAGTTQTNLALTTDIASTCKYSASTNIAYAAMTNIFSATGNTSHSISVSGLSNGQSYSYYIKCQAGSVSNSDDYVISFSVANPPSTSGGSGGGGGYIPPSDTVPPAKVTNLTVSPTENQALLTWTNPIDGDYAKTKIVRKENSHPASITDGAIVFDDNKNSFIDSNLKSGTVYYYSVFTYDSSGNYSPSFQTSITTKGIPSVGGGSSSYPDSSLLKTPDSFKVYVIINQKKKWIPTPEVFETLGHKWTSITSISSNALKTIPDYEDNLIRAIGDYKVYLIVNGIKRHVPNPEIFLDYGFSWGDVKDVPRSTIDSYSKKAYLIRESRQGKIYYLSPDNTKKHIPTSEIFASYNDKWEDVQVISKKEMESYPTSNLMQLIGDSKIYLIENNLKRWIPDIQTFNKYRYEWNLVLGANKAEFDYFKEGERVK